MNTNATVWVSCDKRKAQFVFRRRERGEVFQVNPNDKSFSLATDEDEKGYFFGQIGHSLPHFSAGSTMPKGTYRVVDGTLYRIEYGVTNEH